MKPLFALLRVIWQGQSRAFWRGAALAAMVLMAGVGLLGLSGWFITAAGAAGLAGLGIGFDFFRPSAGVRLLALGRAGARYGERLLTHDATLRALAGLRVHLLGGIMRLPYPRLLRLRGGLALNRLTADVDALDGISLRLVIPMASGALTLALAWAILAWLVDLAVSTAVILAVLGGTAATLAWTLRRAARPSLRAELHMQAFRTMLIDLFRARVELAVFGQLQAQTRAALRREARQRAAANRVDSIDRVAGAALSATATLAAALALLLGLRLAETGAITPAQAALGFFAALALAEVIAPLRRGLSELGRTLVAARRIDRDLRDTGQPAAARAAPAPRDDAPALAFANVALRYPGGAAPLFRDLSFQLRAGETVALTGPSGGGKSSALTLAAGLIAPAAGEIRLRGAPLTAWPETALRATVAFLPQRSALLSGTVRDALTLADPNLDDAGVRALLETVALDDVVARMGGPDARLGEGGAGLSGGEGRRLALARVLARRPRVLLLDEPTEGLDADTARRVLDGLRKALPDAAILTASHRAVEIDRADRVLSITQ
ncbi:amino acid ABC transporter ATP-binding/permease protein [Rhodovulum sp. YNF3179]|uniref:amino acid ABC transporter ATP-binding/permease protein n=1 Tax=Rhodovulum sp. YNF3179 TaxID=3425127 RepID=UPI003D358535